MNIHKRREKKRKIQTSLREPNETCAKKKKTVKAYKT